MALNIATEYTPNVIVADANYPTGSLKNETNPGISNDGTPLTANWGNDYQGFTDALLAAGGVTRSGVADTALASDRLTALNNVIKSTGWGVDDNTLSTYANNDVDDITGIKSGVYAVPAVPTGTLPSAFSGVGIITVKRFNTTQILQSLIDVSNAIQYTRLVSAALSVTSWRTVRDTIVKHYNTTGDVTIDFSDATNHIVTRRGSGNGIVTLSGSPKAGDTLTVENVQDDSGTATITGKTMFTGVGTASDTSHTLTGQFCVTMTCLVDGGDLSIRGVY